MLELWDAYRRAPLADRLWVAARFAMCPWHDVVAALPQTGRILDVGCGRGLLGALVRRHRPALHYVGVDPNPRPVRVAQEALADPVTEFHALPPEEWRQLGRFHCVVLVDVLYAVSLERWPHLLALCAELLEDGGTLVLKETLSTPRWKAAVVRGQETLAIRVLRYTQGEPPHLEAEATYEAALARAGLTLTSSRRVDGHRPWPHHLFVAERRVLPG